MWSLCILVHKWELTNQHRTFNALLQHLCPMSLTGKLWMWRRKWHRFLSELFLDGVELVIEHGKDINRLLVNHSSNSLDSDTAELRDIKTKEIVWIAPSINVSIHITRRDNKIWFSITCQEFSLLWPFTLLLKVSQLKSNAINKNYLVHMHSAAMAQFDS